MGSFLPRRDGRSPNSNSHPDSKSGNGFRNNSAANLRLSAYAQPNTQSNHQAVPPSCHLWSSPTRDASLSSHTLRMGLQGLGGARSGLLLRSCTHGLRVSRLLTSDTTLSSVSLFQLHRLILASVRPSLFKAFAPVSDHRFLIRHRHRRLWHLINLS